MPLEKGAYLRYMGKTKFTKNTKSNAAQSKQIAKNKKAIVMLKHVPEVKTISNFRTYAAAALGVSQFAINTMQQGVGDELRIGDVITLKSIEFNLNIRCTVAESVSRVLLLLDKQNNNAATPVPASQIFDNNTSNLQTCNSVYNPDTVGKNKRYIVLWDSGIIWVDNNTAPFKYTCRIRKRLGWKIHFNGNAGTAADVIDKCLSVYFIGADANINWGYSSNVHYTDS